MIHTHEAALLRVAQLRADAASERLARAARETQRSAPAAADIAEGAAESAAEGAAVEGERRRSGGTQRVPGRRDWSRAA